MAKQKKHTSIFSEEFVQAVQDSVDEWLEHDDFGDNCVTAASLGEEGPFKQFCEADGTALHPERLRLLIMSAVSTGQSNGLVIRRGIGGGVHRVHAKSRKPVVPEAEVQETANSTGPVMDAKVACS